MAPRTTIAITSLLLLLPAILLLTSLPTTHSQAVNLTNCDPVFGCTDFTGISGNPSTDANCAGTPGFFQLTSPNSTTIIAVGNRLLVNWTYAGTDARYPNKSISIYYALIGTTNVALNQIAVTADTWYANPVVVNLAKGVTQFEWMVPNLQTGRYQLRIVGDDLDPFLSQSRGQIPCIRDGQPIPKTSALFRVVGNSQLNNFNDNYGPGSGATAGDGFKGWRSWMAAAFCIAGIMVGAALL
ncbi:hypothetical protein HDU97_003949 [Phlyctochytrium planicorne]|nr:hypothetical protein HDU97_003949 [Phlyctochytrium planicorne]